MDADACAEDSGSAGRDPGHIEIRSAVYFGESAIQTSSAGNDERRREMAGRQLRPVEHDGILRRDERAKPHSDGSRGHA